MITYDFPPLDTERLRLRALADHDVFALLALYGDGDVMRYWSHGPWVALAQAQAAVEESRREMATGRSVHLAIEVRGDGALAGSCALYDIDMRNRRATLGYMLAPSHRKLGYAAEAIDALVEHGFESRGLYRIEAEVDVRNDDSAGLLERLGFRREGRMHGRWMVDGECRDVDMWALLRDA